MRSSDRYEFDDSVSISFCVVNFCGFCVFVCANICYANNESNDPNEEEKKSEHTNRLLSSFEWLEEGITTMHAIFTMRRDG